MGSAKVKKVKKIMDGWYLVILKDLKTKEKYIVEVEEEDLPDWSKGSIRGWDDDDDNPFRDETILKEKKKEESDFDKTQRILCEHLTVKDIQLWLRRQAMYDKDLWQRLKVGSLKKYLYPQDWIKTMEDFQNEAMPLLFFPDNWRQLIHYVIYEKKFPIWIRMKRRFCKHRYYPLEKFSGSSSAFFGIKYCKKCNKLDRWDYGIRYKWTDEELEELGKACQRKGLVELMLFAMYPSELPYIIDYLM